MRAKLPYLICIVVLCVALVTSSVMWHQKSKEYKKQIYQDEIQICLLMHQYDFALETCEKLLEMFPNHIEMRVLYCVLCKKCYNETESEKIFDETIKIFDKIKIGNKSQEKQFSLYSSYFVLAKLYNRDDLFEKYYNKLSEFDIPDAKMIDLIAIMDEGEFYEMFGIES